MISPTLSPRKMLSFDSVAEAHGLIYPRPLSENFNPVRSHLTEWYDFSNVKSSNMSSLASVVEAYDLVYPHPSGENSSFVS